VVPVLPVFATSVDHVFPLLVDLSIMYPVMGEPPLFAGAVQFRSIWRIFAVAVSPVGGCGTVL
jgi:hypothetical protein